MALRAVQQALEGTPATTRALVPLTAAHLQAAVRLVQTQQARPCGFYA